MKIIKKVSTVGTSLCVILDKVVCNSLEIQRGDTVEIQIKKVNEDDSKG